MFIITQVRLDQGSGIGKMIGRQWSRNTMAEAVQLVCVETQNGYGYTVDPVHVEQDCGWEADEGTGGFVIGQLED